jgi:hypothetical protein
MLLVWTYLKMLRLRVMMRIGLCMGTALIPKMMRLFRLESGPSSDLYIHLRKCGPQLRILLTINRQDCSSHPVHSCRITITDQYTDHLTRSSTILYDLSSYHTLLSNNILSILPIVSTDSTLHPTDHKLAGSQHCHSHLLLLDSCTTTSNQRTGYLIQSSIIPL